MAERKYTNEIALATSLEGKAFAMAQSGLSYDVMLLGDLASIIKPLQMANGLNPSGPNQLAELLATGTMVSSRRNEYMVKLISGKKIPSVELERLDTDWTMTNQANASTVKKAVRTAETFNSRPFYQTSLEVKESIDRAFTTDGVVELMQFTCPPINGRLLSPTGSEDYILTDPTGSNLEADGNATRLGNLIDAIQKAGFSTRLRLIIGDQDEPDYMFPVLGEPANYNSDRADDRKSDYARNLTARVNDQYPKWNASIDRMSDIEIITEDLPAPLSVDAEQTQQDMLVESEQMKRVFLEGGYYYGLAKPNDEQLQQIVELKFRTYGRQGFKLKQMYPNAILLQNELPVDVRSRMINAGLVQLNEPSIGVLYPYGR